MGAALLVEAVEAAMVIEPGPADAGRAMGHLSTLLLVQPGAIQMLASGLVQPVLDLYSTGRSYTRIHQEVFLTTVGPACAMYVVHRHPAGRFVPTRRTWCER